MTMIVTLAVSWLLSLLSASQATAPKQAVVETSAGTFVIDLTPQTAPNYVALFMRLAGEGAYDGTTFHGMVKFGMVQGGDPLSKDPGKRELYGRGGFDVVKADPLSPKMSRGSVGAVLLPGEPDSAGGQFFILLADQPALDGKYTVFGQVAEGMEVVQNISATPVDDKGMATERIEIRRITIRDAPPPPPDPFLTATVEELASHRAVLDTSAGPITIELFTDKAPNHVRQFFRLATMGVFDGTAFHRVVPGFVIQTGALSSRQTPLTERQRKVVTNLQPEFNDTKHVKGIVSMARGDDPASATTSFFICTGESAALDGHYTAFGRVVDGMSVVEAIEATPRDGETPTTRIELKSVRVEPRP